MQKTVSSTPPPELALSLRQILNGSMRYTTFRPLQMARMCSQISVSRNNQKISDGSRRAIIVMTPTASVAQVSEHPVGATEVSNWNDLRPTVNFADAG